MDAHGFAMHAQRAGISSRQRRAIERPPFVWHPRDTHDAGPPGFPRRRPLAKRCLLMLARTAVKQEKALYAIISPMFPNVQAPRPNPLAGLQVFEKIVDHVQVSIVPTAWFLAYVFMC